MIHNIKEKYSIQILALLRKIAILLLLYSICRVFFFLFNNNYFKDSSGFELLKIFIFGIRFDYASIIQFNILFIVLYLLPFSFATHRTYKRWLLVAFWIFNGLLLLFNFADIEYFKYSSKRSTVDIFKLIFMSDDVSKLMPQFLRDFWYIPILWAITLYFGIWLSLKPKFKQLTFTIRNSIFGFIIMVILTGLLFMTARGFGMKPIRIISAARYSSSQNIPLLLNTPFTILHTIQEDKLIKREYFSSDSCKLFFTPNRQYPAYQKPRSNVIILILESFSHEFIGTLSHQKTYTPFLDSLFNESLLFENGFANCRRSIEGIPAVLAGLPSLNDEAYISSHFSGNRLEAMPEILQKHGYSTAFFHGGRNGTMGFDEFSKVAGIQYYYGLSEYDGPPAFDGNWGIFDNEFLQYSITKMSQLKTPFFSTIFTLSSHHPYTVPAPFDKLIPKNEEPQLRAVRYTDLSLRNFFNTARKQPWFKNTLFVFVADHTAKIINQEYNNPVGTYRIPIVFYSSGNDSLKNRRTDIAQQTDIMPSVLNYLGIEDHFLSFGSSVFSKSRSPYSISYLGGIFYYFQSDFVLCFDGDKSVGLYDFMHDKKLQNNLMNNNKSVLKEMEFQLKSIIQDYYSRMIDNNLIYREQDDYNKQK
jgi:phosphoglycerol transferase MdoB-like AlkP superfamily enzyme